MAGLRRSGGALGACCASLLLLAPGGGWAAEERAGAASAGAAVDYRVVLVGDAGYPERGRALLEQLGDFVRHSGEVLAQRTALVYLGDNSYREGPEILDAQGRSPELAPQLEAGRGIAHLLFLPGNHDWDISSLGFIDYEEGIRRLRAEARYVEDAGAARWSPRAGCPGPEAIELGPAKLVALDSTWWFLDPGERERLAREAGCPRSSEAEVVAALRRQLACAEASCPPRVLLAHHPLASNGSHGGYFPAREHLWCAEPLPVPLGCSLLVLARRSGLAPQDQASPPYRRFVRGVREAMEKAPPLVYAGGHEHTLEVLDDPQAGVLLVSGGGSKPKPVRDGPRFRVSQHGFMVLDFMADGRVRLRVHASGGPAGLHPPVYEEDLTRAGG